MEEIESLDWIKEYANKTNREAYLKEEEYDKGTGFHNFIRYKRTAYMANNKDESSFFIWLGDPYAEFTWFTSYCGVFIPIDIPLDNKFCIRKKDFLDKINPALKDIPIGDIKFDRQHVISGNKSESIRQLLKSDEIKAQLSSSLNVTEGLRIHINEPSIDFVPYFNDKAYLGIVFGQGWILEGHIIEDLFQIAEDLKKYL
jgi:hypothetical protein